MRHPKTSESAAHCIGTSLDLHLTAVGLNSADAAWMEKLTTVAAAAASAAAAKAVQSSAAPAWALQRPWLPPALTLAQLRQQVSQSSPGEETIQADHFMTTSTC